ncbi:MAG: hypothetical protein IT380_09920 [Myxococcales bacterium]|nr:hypothetical protein [Myxococcales bacterium]
MPATDKPPRDFFELLVATGVPDSEGWLVLPLEFLRHGQAGLTDDDFLALCEGLRGTAPVGNEHESGHHYPGKQAKLIRDAGLDAGSATRVVGRLKKLGLVKKDGGRLSFASFWAKYPAGKKAAYMRLPAWVFYNFRQLGWTSRDFRLLTLLGSYYAPDNTAPLLSGTLVGDILGIDRSQASRDLQGLVDRASLTPGFPVGSRTPRGYEFSGLCRFLEIRLHELDGRTAPSAGPVGPASPATAPDFGDFFGTAATSQEQNTVTGGSTKRKGSSAQTSKVAPDEVHKALAKFIKTESRHIAEGQQDRALGVARLVQGSNPISAAQELSLYRDAARIAKVDWNLRTPAMALREALVKALGLHQWKIEPGIVAVIADTVFGRQPSKKEIHDLATRCGSRDEVRAALAAMGYKPVQSQPS